MNFDQKLNALMHLFKISNSQMARGISIDASLVSRWKSGERKISDNSPHIPMLANYFLHLNAYQYQKEYLERIIVARLPEKQRLDETSRVHVLADWLVSEELPDPQPDEQPEELAKSVSLISSISQMLADSGRNGTGQAQTDAANQRPSDAGQPQALDWQSMTKPGKALTYEVFEGRSGKRQAVLNMLCQVLQSEHILDILLTSEDDTMWITEDRSFALLWASLLRQVILQGHQITVIHVVNRRTNEILNMLNYWMPLHLSGRMNSCYYPRYGERQVRQTLFIIRGQQALVANNIADYTGNELSFVFKDKATIEQFTRQFMVHLSQCRPLFAVYTPQNVRAFFEQNLELNRRPGAVYNIRHQLNLRLLPISILKPYLRKAHGKIPESQLIGWLEIQQNDFFNFLEHESYIDILPASLLESILDQKHNSLACCEVFSERQLIVKPADTLLWLQHTVDTLRRFENYEVYIFNDIHANHALSINITYKENTVAQFAPSHRDKHPASIIQLSENNVLHSLSYYFDDFIQQIPSSMRSKADVIVRLERLITNLAGSKTKARSNSSKNNNKSDKEKET